MNVKHLKSMLVGGLMVAALSFVSVGCNENEVDPPDDGTAPAAPTNVKAVSLGATEVGLMWNASVDSGVTYTVKAVSTGTVADTQTVNNLTSTSTSISGLTQGKTYTFSVYSVRGGLMSSAASIIWAPAQRYNTSGQTMRLYEYASSNGSGLTIDPAKGGPKNISVRNASGDVQLALYNKDRDNASDDTLLIGAAYAIEEYRNVNAFDINTYVSSSIYAVPSLDQWYEDQSLTNRFDATGNLYYYKVLQKVSGTNTYMFYVRTGTTGNYHYARVMLKKDGSGNIFQGTAPNRYVEVEISYQTVPDLPYAKVPAGAITPKAVIRATRGL